MPRKQIVKLLVFECYAGEPGDDLRAAAIYDDLDDCLDDARDALEAGREIAITPGEMTRAEYESLGAEFPPDENPLLR